MGKRFRRNISELCLLILEAPECDVARLKTRLPDDRRGLRLHAYAIDPEPDVQRIGVSLG